MPFVNITKDDTEPHYQNVSDIVAVEFHEGLKEGSRAVSLFGSEGVLLPNADLEKWNIDADDLVKKLRDADVPLVLMNDRYINPGAVTCIAASAINDKGQQNIVFGVKGLGMQQSRGLMPEELDAFISAVRAVKTLREHQTEGVSSRSGNKPGGLYYIDPASVAYIIDMGRGKMEIGFDLSGSLGIDIPEHDENEFRKNLPDPEPVSEEGKTGRHIFNGFDYTGVFNEMTRRKDKADKVARFKFSNELAAAAGGLVAIPSPDTATHIRREDISRASLTEDDRDVKRTVLYIMLKKSNNDLCIYFDKRKDAEDALDVVTGKTEPPRAKPTVAPAFPPSMKP